MVDIREILTKRPSIAYCMPRKFTPLASTTMEFWSGRRRVKAQPSLDLLLVALQHMPKTLQQLLALLLLLASRTK